MNFTLYSIGNFDFLVEVLRATDAMFASGYADGFIVGIGFLLAMFIAFIKQIAGSQTPFNNLIGGFVMYVVLFTQSMQVNVESVRTGEIFGPLDNIPLGIAVPGYVISTFGVGLTEDYTANYSVPGMSGRAGNDAYNALLKYFYYSPTPEVCASGTLGLDICNAVQRYYTDCVVNGLAVNQPNLLTQLRETPLAQLSGHTIWSTGPSAYATTFTDSTGSTTLECSVADDVLRTEFVATPFTDALTSSMERQKINLQDLEFGYERLSGTDVSQLQIQLGKFQTWYMGMVGGTSETGGFLGEAERWQAQQERNIQNAVERSMWVEMAEPMLSFIEAFVYFVAPFMPFLVTLGSFGSKLMMNYFVLLLWASLWPVMLSAVNLFTSISIERVLDCGYQGNNLYTGCGTAEALSWGSIESTHATIESYLATAGNLTATIPALALFLLYGGIHGLKGVAAQMGSGRSNRGSSLQPQTPMGMTGGRSMSGDVQASVGSDAASYARMQQAGAGGIAMPSISGAGIMASGFSAAQAGAMPAASGAGQSALRSTSAMAQMVQSGAMAKSADNKVAADANKVMSSTKQFQEKHGGKISENPGTQSRVASAVSAAAHVGGAITPAAGKQLAAQIGAEEGLNQRQQRSLANAIQESYGTGSGFQPALSLQNGKSGEHASRVGNALGFDAAQIQQEAQTFERGRQQTPAARTQASSPDDSGSDVNVDPIALGSSIREHGPLYDALKSGELLNDAILPEMARQRLSAEDAGQFQKSFDRIKNGQSEQSVGDLTEQYLGQRINFTQGGQGQDSGYRQYLADRFRETDNESASIGNALSKLGSEFFADPQRQIASNASEVAGLTGAVFQKVANETGDTRLGMVARELNAAAQQNESQGIVSDSLFQPTSIGRGSDALLPENDNDPHINQSVAVGSNNAESRDPARETQDPQSVVSTSQNAQQNQVTDSGDIADSSVIPAVAQAGRIDTGLEDNPVRILSQGALEAANFAGDVASNSFGENANNTMGEHVAFESGSPGFEAAENSTGEIQRSQALESPGVGTDGVEQGDTAEDGLGRTQTSSFANAADSAVDGSGATSQNLSDRGGYTPQPESFVSASSQNNDSAQNSSNINSPEINPDGESGGVRIEENDNLAGRESTPSATPQAGEQLQQAPADAATGENEGIASAQNRVLEGSQEVAATSSQEASQAREASTEISSVKTEKEAVESEQGSRVNALAADNTETNDNNNSQSREVATESASGAEENNVVRGDKQASSELETSVSNDIGQSRDATTGDSSGQTETDVPAAQQQSADAQRTEKYQALPKEPVRSREAIPGNSAYSEDSVNDVDKERAQTEEQSENTEETATNASAEQDTPQSRKVTPGNSAHSADAANNLDKDTAQPEEQIVTIEAIESNVSTEQDTPQSRKVTPGNSAHSADSANSLDKDTAQPEEQTEITEGIETNASAAKDAPQSRKAIPGNSAYSIGNDTAEIEEEADVSEDKETTDAATRSGKATPGNSAYSIGNDTSEIEEEADVDEDQEASSSAIQSRKATPGNSAYRTADETIENEEETDVSEGEEATGSVTQSPKAATGNSVFVNDKDTEENQQESESEALVSSAKPASRHQDLADDEDSVDTTNAEQNRAETIAVASEPEPEISAAQARETDTVGASGIVNAETPETVQQTDVNVNPQSSASELAAQNANEPVTADVPVANASVESVPVEAVTESGNAQPSAFENSTQPQRHENTEELTSGEVQNSQVESAPEPQRRDRLDDVYVGDIQVQSAPQVETPSFDVPVLSDSLSNAGITGSFSTGSDNVQTLFGVSNAFDAFDTAQTGMDAFGAISIDDAIMNPGEKTKVKTEYLQGETFQSGSEGDESSESASAESEGTTSK